MSSISLLAQSAPLVHAMPMEAFPIIDKLGGRKRVAAILGITPNAIRMWTRRGHIPGYQQVALWDAAIKRRIRTKPEDFKAPQNREAA
jgi:hypothetical protein